MPYYQFLWTPDILNHVDEHGVTIEEFEEIVMDPDFVTSSRSSGRPAAEGFTSTGKYLFCVYELLEDGVTVLPVTAYEV
ncbi:MAG: hypothetical protein HON04_06240 [Planctomicrobium sp.]|jgi:hypothetical protein|nr:hypothetical protein [Planctomicrobium sp.]